MSANLLKPEPAPFRIGWQGTKITGNADEYARRFAELPILLFEDAFDPGLIEKLAARAAQGNYDHTLVDGVGHRRFESNAKIGPACTVLLDRPALRDWLGRLAGGIELGRVTGRLGESHAGADEEFGWHTDMSEPDRKLGLVIDFTLGSYVGGEFELRRSGTAHKLARVRHTQPGSLAIFAVGHHLDHRVMPVTSGGPRRVFSGWFLGG